MYEPKLNYFSKPHRRRRQRRLCLALFTIELISLNYHREHKDLCILHICEFHPESLHFVETVRVMAPSYLRYLDAKKLEGGV